MCGIFGIFYTPESKLAEDFGPTELAQMLFPAIRHRGPHAFGWMTYNPLHGISYEKHEGDVQYADRLALVELDNQAMWMVGHVRWATHGSTGDMRNNHPIPHGDVIGVHNGVLRNDDEILAITGRESDGTLVDSEAIFAAVNKWGHRGGLRRIKGDMVTVYTKQSKPEWLYMAKSHGRPLVLARTKAGSLVFASELGVLEEVWGKELTDIRQLKGNQLIRVADSKVVESVQYQEDPPAPVRSPMPRQGAASRSNTWDGVRGITDYYDTKRRQLEASLSAAAKVSGPAPKATPQLSKKQRKRAKRAAAARQTDRDKWGQGFYWVGGQCLTPSEFAEYMKSEEGK